VRTHLIRLDHLPSSSHPFDIYDTRPAKFNLMPQHRHFVNTGISLFRNSKARHSPRSWPLRAQAPKPTGTQSKISPRSETRKLRWRVGVSLFWTGSSRLVIYMAPIIWPQLFARPEQWKLYGQAQKARASSKTDPRASDCKLRGFAEALREFLPCGLVSEDPEPFSPGEMSPLALPRKPYSISPCHHSISLASPRP
jgi:hypothetical protein